MTKQTITCNHCGESVEWYPSFMREVGYVAVDDKIYCEICLKRLAHKGVDF